MKNIKRLSERAGVIVISHRLANVVPADRIYFLADGAVCESGNHAELMAAHGGYAKLYTAQKELEEGYARTAGKRLAEEAAL